MGLFSNIALIWKNRDKIQIARTEAAKIEAAIKAAPSTGYISSEFLTTILGAGFLLWNTFSGHPLPDLTQELVAVIVGVYTFARTGLKAIHQLIAAWHGVATQPVPTVIAPSTTTAS